LKDISDDLSNQGKDPTLVIEDVGTQKGFIQDLRYEGYPVKEFSPGSQDKYSRLWRASSLFSSSNVYFPRNGAENLIKQLTNFGVVKQHDDLVDACTMAVLYMADSRRKKSKAYTVKPYPF